jgi:hypothetical protein
MEQDECFICLHSSFSIHLFISPSTSVTPCIMHRWNKNHPLPFQNHNLPTYLPTHLLIKFLTYLCVFFPTSQALVATFSLFTLPTFSLFLSKITPYLPTYQPTYLSNFLLTYVLLFLPPRLLYLHSHFLLSHYPPYLPSQYFITTVLNPDGQWLLDLNGNCP